MTTLDLESTGKRIFASMTRIPRDLLECSHKTLTVKHDGQDVVFRGVRLDNCNAIVATIGDSGRAVPVFRWRPK